MAAAVPFITAGLAVAGGLGQMSAAKRMESAAESSRALADANARRIELEAEEETRRLKKEQARRESTVRAYAAASGVTLSSGSVGTYLEEMETEHRQQRDWLASSARDRADIARFEGELGAQEIDYRAQQQRWRAVSSFGRGFGAGAEAGWFG